MRDGRSSSRPQLFETTARARSRRMSRPRSLLTSYATTPSCVSAMDTFRTPGTACSAGAASWPAASICRYIVSEPRSRAVRFAGVSTATTRPLLMMTTRSQVCDTSGRMCVLRTIVCVPASSLMSWRVSMICFGSSPAVGSSRMSTSGLCRIACARPTRWR